MPFNRIILAATLCVILIIYAILIAAMPAQLRQGAFDFMIFYTAGTIVREHNPHNLYNLDQQRQIQAQIMGRDDFIAGGLLPFNHIPVVAWLAAPMTALPYETAYPIWLMLMVACLAGVALCLFPLLPKLKLPDRVLLLLGLFIIYPLFTSLLKGQDTALLILGLALAARGLQTQRPWFIALGLALLWIKPYYAVLFVALFLITYREASWQIIGTSLLFALLNVLLVGYQGVLDFITLIRLSNTGENLGINTAAMINLTGFMLRILPLSLNDLQYVKWLIYAAGFGLLIWRWRRDGATLTNFGLAAVLCPLIATHAHVHDLSFIMIGWFVLSIWLINQHYQRLGLWLAPACTVLLFTLSLINETLFLNTCVLIACLTALALLRIKDHGDIKMPPLRLEEGAKA